MSPQRHRQLKRLVTIYRQQLQQLEIDLLRCKRELANRRGEVEQLADRRQLTWNHYDAGISPLHLQLMPSVQDFWQVLERSRAEAEQQLAAAETAWESAWQRFREQRTRTESLEALHRRELEKYQHWLARQDRQAQEETNMRRWFNDRQGSPEETMPPDPSR